jgi:hypothetical protein
MRNTCTVENCTAFVVGRGLCRKHYMRVNRNGTTETFRDDPLKRFWRRVEKTRTCWNWLGPLQLGYGRVVVQQRPTRLVMAHRYAYELLRHPIPKGMTIDHLCKNKRCVNPAHMEIVTRSENAKRGNPLLKRCKRGHLMRGDNVYFPPKGPRQCRACKWLHHIRSHPRSQLKSRRG